jgi:quinoprotein glucose dehydrogenase
MGGVLPTDVTFGPDGMLYLSDWVDGWPKSNKGRIYSVSPIKTDPEQVKISAELAELLAKGMKDLNAEEVTALLSHPDRRARLNAQLELVSRGGTGVAAFSRLVWDDSEDPLARLHAIWGLGMLAKEYVTASPTLLKLLDDKDPEVVAQSIRALGDLQYKPAYPAILKKLEYTAPRVQFFAAQALGKFRNAKATAPLLRFIRRNADKDAYLRFAAAHSLAQIGRNGTLDEAAKSDFAAERLGVVLAYRELASPAIAHLLNDKDPYIAREVAEAINDAPIEGAYSALAAKLSTAPVKDEAFVLRAINANYRLGGGIQALTLSEYAQRSDATPAMRAEALLQLGLWAKVPQRDRVVGIYRPLLQRGGKVAADVVAGVAPKLLGNAPEEVQLAAIEAIGTLEVRDAAPALVAVVGNDKAPESVRTAALRSLDAFGAGEVLPGIDAAEKSTVAGLRLAALQIVAKRAPDRALPIISKLATDGTEAEQQAAFLSMGQLQGAGAQKLLVASLDQLAAGKVQPGAQVELIDAVEKSTAPAVKARWEKQQAAWAASGDPLAAYGFALAGGDPMRGAEQFFENQILPCARCHKVNGEGGEAGPDLTLVAKDHPVQYLLESVVKPSAHIAKGFDNVTLTLKNGNTETGSLVSESAKEIVLKRADGSEAKVEVAQVKQRVTAPSSMPEMYGQVLTHAQLRDVVAFLTKLDQRRGNAEPAPGVSNRAMSSVAVEGPVGGHP